MTIEELDKLVLIETLKSAYPKKDEEASAYLNGVFIALNHAYGREFADEVTNAIESNFLERFVL